MLGVAARGGAVILATHDAEVADRCDHVLDLRVAVGRLGTPSGGWRAISTLGPTRGPIWFSGVFATVEA
jgi:hypothetical protein